MNPDSATPQESDTLQPMPYSLSMSQTPHMVVAVLTGQPGHRDVLGVIERIANATHAQGAQRLVVELLSVNVDFTTAQHEEIGACVARSWGHLNRVASVINLDARNGISEREARRQGLEVKVFHEINAAIAWVSSEPAPPCIGAEAASPP
ncbi:MAG: hypothetical protein ABIR26_08295 [Ramlibacter sp.]